MTITTTNSSPQDTTNKDAWFSCRTPKAPCTYLYLLKPDTKFKAEGKYSITILLDPKNSEHKAFLDLLNGKNDEVFTRRLAEIKRGREEFRKKPLFHIEYQKGTDVPTGMLSLKASTTKPFAIFGPKASEGQLPREFLKKVWSGSTCKIAISLKEHVDNSKKNIGYVVYFDKVQFIDIVSGTGGNPGPAFDDEQGTTTTVNTQDSVEDSPEVPTSDSEEVSF